MIRKIKGYGWKPDLPDIRDHLFKMSRLTDIALPDTLYLSHKLPPCYDQGKLGSCTANALAAVLEFDANRQGEINVKTPSRLFIYYNERVLTQSTQYDSGAMLRDGIKVVNEEGAPPESLWPYDIEEFTVQPPQSVYDAATAHETLEYSRVDNTDENTLRLILANGFPMVFGFTVYDNFESPGFKDNGYHLNLPTGQMIQLGGHAVVLAGYNHPTREFLIRNSWGIKWGLSGYFWMPYEYVTCNDLATDFWLVSKVK